MKIKKTKVNGEGMPCFSVESLNIGKKSLLSHWSIESVHSQSKLQQDFFVEIGGWF